MGEASHALGEVFGAANQFRALAQERDQQILSLLHPLMVGDDVPVLHLRQPDRHMMAALEEPAKFEIVGQHEILERATVAVELIGLEGSVSETPISFAST